MTVDDFPLVHPAEVVACALTCLDELDAICVADAALNHGDTTKEEIAELLVGRYSKAARLRLDQADAAARSHVETGRIYADARLRRAALPLHSSLRRMPI